MQYFVIRQEEIPLTQIVMAWTHTYAQAWEQFFNIIIYLLWIIGLPILKSIGLMPSIRGDFACSIWHPLMLLNQSAYNRFFMSIIFHHYKQIARLSKGWWKSRLVVINPPTRPSKKLNIWISLLISLFCLLNET